VRLAKERTMLSGTARSLPAMSFSMPAAYAARGPRLAASSAFGWSGLPQMWAPAPLARGAGRGPAADEFRFGSFRLLPEARTLLRDGRPVECGSRAFDLLHVLLLSRGKVVAKEAIVRHVWPTTVVEESNLRFQMASLRKVLGEDRVLIKTIPGRGYLFASEFGGPDAEAR
jgi:DNA-binding winged helix-turn-helix (wHTH) protein